MVTLCFMILRKSMFNAAASVKISPRYFQLNYLGSSTLQSAISGSVTNQLTTNYQKEIDNLKQQLQATEP